ncbi:MAG: thioesterase family protein [Pseudomonadales bacterium]
MNNKAILTQAPIECPEKTVLPEWIDYNGHMNMAYYHVVFDQCLDYVFDLLGVGADYVRDQGSSMFSREVHVNYLAEAIEGQTLLVTFALLDHDSKRLHFLEQMYSKDSKELLATSEQLALHVNMAQRKSAPFPPEIRGQLEALADAHKTLPFPQAAGRTIGIRRSPR